jgi:hypothetical protein
MAMRLLCLIFCQLLGWLGVLAQRSATKHPALWILTDDGHLSTSIQRFEPQRPVRTVLVVMLDIDSQDLLQVAPQHAARPPGDSRSVLLLRT